MNQEYFDTLSFAISALVIGGICAEFLGIVLGLINANELLIVCTIGGLANLLALRLSKKVLADQH